MQKFAPLNASLKPLLNILVINVDEKFSKELSKEHSKRQNFFTRIGPLVFVLALVARVTIETPLPAWYGVIS